MAYVRDSDTSLWLHNKLGTNDLWSSHSICSQLNSDILRKIPQIFPELQSQVKLKLILAILHIPLRNMVEWSAELKAILLKASQDTDPWVAMLSDLLRTYPDDGTLFLDPESGGFCELLSELRKIVRSRQPEQVLPEEFLYLDKRASNALLGSPPKPAKHFVVKKQPKSFQIKNEYLQKAQEAQNTKRAVSNSVVPLRYRGMSKLSTDSPLRGIPSNRLSGSFRSPISSLNRSLGKTPNRKESGIKLLDFGEQPMGRDAKRRKKNVEEEGIKKDEKKAEDEKKIVEEENDDSSGGLNPPATPDYAAGLLSSMPVPSPAPATPSYGAIPSISKVPASPAPKTPSHTPQYANVPGTPQTPVPQSPIASPQQNPSTPTKYITTQIVSSQNQSNVDSRPSYAASTLLSSPLNQTQSSQPQSVVVQGQTYTVQASNFNGQSQIQPNGQTIIQTSPMIQQRVANTSNFMQTTSYQNMVINPGTQVLQSSNGTQYVIRQAPQVVRTGGVQPVSVQSLGGLQQVQPNGIRLQRIIRTPVVTQPHQEQTSRSLSLSQAQFNDAQEMFRNSNKVTRSEKALILGFIAGNRQNPCPNLGDVITIVLNEEQQNHQQSDGTLRTVLVQTHFEMDYSNGTWNTKIRHISEGQNRTPSHVIVPPPQ